ncbi:MAG TPA: PaaI family thioesterase [Kofleriaceae bacterium]
MRMTLPELEALLDEHTPHWRSACRIDSLGEHQIVVTMPFRPDFVRAGGTIAGPPVMTLADRTAYYLTLALAGPRPAAVTANLAIHFLTRAEPGDLTATATMLRLGRRLAVSAVDVRSRDTLVAHATVTYALPVD